EPPSETHLSSFRKGDVAVAVFCEPRAASRQAPCQVSDVAVGRKSRAIPSSHAAQVGEAATTRRRQFTECERLFRGRRQRGRVPEGIARAASPSLASTARRRTADLL